MKPILFNTEMVRAILEGRKTETRRVIKPVGQQRQFWKPLHDRFIIQEVEPQKWQIWLDKIGNPYTSAIPPYQPGDILWVRETWNYGYIETPDQPGTYDPLFKEVQGNPSSGPFLYLSAISGYFYKADEYEPGVDLHMTWRPSIHMPKEAARLFLRVTDVMAERLQDITNEQARAEGCDGRCLGTSSGAEGSISCITMDFSKERFETVWDRTLKPSDRDKYGWYANPWVWVIEFERIKKEKVI